MERSSREWLVPLTGILFAVLLIVSFIIQGEPKDASHSADEVKNWYLDNKDAAEVSAFIGTVAGAALIFYGAYLRRLFSTALGEGAMLPILVLIGVTIVAIGGAIDNMLMFATAERADDIPAQSVQTIQAIWDNDFLPIAMGVIVFNWAVGLSILKSDGVLPRWLGWVMVVLGVLSLAGPVGFVGVIGAALFVIVSSIMLAVRARSGTAPATV